MSKPIFNVAEVDGVIVLTMNSSCATDFVECLQDFDDLGNHELAMREQIRTALRSAARRRRRFAGGNADEGEPAGQVAE